MALVQKKLSESKQIKLILIFLLVIVVTLFVAYLGLFRKSNNDQEYNIPDQQIPISGIIPEKNAFDQIKGMVENSVFENFKQFGNWPLSIEPKGRPQPFIEKMVE
jgi:hypothetical protein